MRKVLWSALVIALSLTLLILGSSCTKNVLVDAAYSGRQVQLSVGQLLIITLESNATTGYSWTLIQNSDESVLQKTGNKYIPSDKRTLTPLTGVGGKEEWTFKGLKIRYQHDFHGLQPTLGKYSASRNFQFDSSRQVECFR